VNPLVSLLRFLRLKPRFNDAAFSGERDSCRLNGRDRRSSKNKFKEQEKESQRMKEKRNVK